MNFQQSLDYLYALGNEVVAMKPGLAATEKLLAALGNPERKFLKIQVAGTNGKGSTCAFLDAICRSAQIKTGLFTSPHLINITERIKIGGAEISQTDFAEHATRVREIAENLLGAGELEFAPTFFEQITAIAISAFGEEKIELAILETGLGGRFDSVTAARAEIVGITKIDFDHQNILGNSLSEIAAEKAAIIRADTQVVLTKQSREAEKIVLEICANFRVKPRISNFKFQIVGTLEDGKYIVNFLTRKTSYKNVCLNLLGKHQIENARIAILLAEILQENGFKITSEDIVKGLQTAVHTGRLEFYKGVLLDGAHNVGGAKALKNYLYEFTKKPITMIFGAMRDKDLSSIAETLFPQAAILILTKPDNPRALDTSEIIKFVPKNFNQKNVYQTETVAEALKKAVEFSANNLICVTGSLYLVGEARKRLAVVG